MTNATQRIKYLLLLSDISLGKFTARDSYGSKFSCETSIPRDGAIFIQIKINPIFSDYKSNKVLTENLCDDPAIIFDCINFFRSLGYAGPSFGRAELGIQGEDYIMLEPYSEFMSFAESLGWRNLHEED